MRVVPTPLPVAKKDRLRAIIRDANWKSSTSDEYKDAPHSYIIYFKDSKAHHPGWKFFAECIRLHGTMRKWRKSQFKYLIVDSYAYWVCWPAVNRVKADTLA